MGTIKEIYILLSLSVIWVSLANAGDDTAKKISNNIRDNKSSEKEFHAKLNQCIEINCYEMEKSPNAQCRYEILKFDLGVYHKDVRQKQFKEEYSKKYTNCLKKAVDKYKGDALDDCGTEDDMKKKFEKKVKCFFKVLEIE